MALPGPTGEPKLRIGFLSFEFDAGCRSPWATPGAPREPKFRIEF